MQTVQNPEFSNGQQPFNKEVSMGCLGWFLIITGVIGFLTPFSPLGIGAIIIGIVILALRKSSKRTQDAVERTAELNQRQSDELKEKELWVAQRMNVLISEGMPISDAKAKAEMEYTLYKNDKN